MKAVIVHSDGRNTDLSRGVDPATYAELENARYSRSNPALWCGTCGGSIYIRHGSRRKDELFGAHHDAGSCEARLVISPAGMSDEHKRQAEYHALAAEHAGHRAQLEVSTTGRTRVDVVINGSVGIEVQWSALTRAAARDRTARSISAGLRSVTWFTARTEDPLWSGHVPGYRTTARPDLWKHLPEPRSAYSAGLRIIEAVRCGTRTICRHRAELAPGSSRGTRPGNSSWSTTSSRAWPRTRSGRYGCTGTSSFCRLPASASTKNSPDSNCPAMTRASRRQHSHRLPGRNATTYSRCLTTRRHASAPGWKPNSSESPSSAGDATRPCSERRATPRQITRAPASSAASKWCRTRSPAPAPSVSMPWRRHGAAMPARNQDHAHCAQATTSPASSAAASTASGPTARTRITAQRHEPCARESQSPC